MAIQTPQRSPATSLSSMASIRRASIQARPEQ